MIVDSHVHVVSPDTERYPLSPRDLSGTWYLDAPCSAPDLAAQMASAGVDRAILVQGVGAYTYDNSYAADSARVDSEHFASACCIDPLAADASERLAYWATERGMQGVRMFSVGEGAAALDDPATFPIWEKAGELGLHVIATILAEQLPQLRHVLERFPNTAVSLDHCGFPDPEKPESLLELARFANLYLKVTTHLLDDGAEHDGTPKRIVNILVDHFGAKRIQWGSDYCQIHDRPYAELVELGRQAFADRSAEERDWCLGGTALRLWPAIRRA